MRRIKEWTDETNRHRLIDNIRKRKFPPIYDGLYIDIKVVRIYEIGERYYLLLIKKARFEYIV